MIYTKHYLGEFDEETRIQRCILCGEIIVDYSCAAWFGGGEAPKGWKEGDFYISGGCPQWLTSEINEDENFKNCI